MTEPRKSCALTRHCDAFRPNVKLGSRRSPTNRIRSAKPGLARVVAQLPDRM
jgi:hypothetical protein